MRLRTVRKPVDRVDLGCGDQITFRQDDHPFTVRAVSPDGRWAICTRRITDQDRAVVNSDGEPWITSDTSSIIYTIIDFDSGVRGPDNFGGLGYETPEEITDALERLVAGEAEVSVRYDVYLDIDDVDRAARAEADR